ncbi:MAG: transposase [Candidatus Margulisiibacteriota bacterium]
MPENEQQKTKKDIVFMWLSGMQSPDFRTINDFRKEMIEEIRGVFQEVLRICIELKIIKCGKVSLDGTKVEAYSSRNKMEYRKSLEKRKTGYEEQIDRILEEAEQIDAEEDALYGDRDGYTLDRPVTEKEVRQAVKNINKRQARLQKKKKKLEEKKEVVEEKLKTMGTDRNSYSRTDEDATFMQMKEGYLSPGYNIQMATEGQVILAYGVYQNRADVNLLRPMIDEVRTNMGELPEYICTDKGYGSQKNYEYIEELKKEGLNGAAIPHQNYDYDRVAINKGTYKLSKNMDYERLKLKMMKFIGTEKGQYLLERRKHDVEPTFGDIKYNMGYRKCLLRTMKKVNVEIGLMAIAHNIKKIRQYIEGGTLPPFSNAMNLLLNILVNNILGMFRKLFPARYYLPACG